MMRASAAALSALMSGCCGPASGGAKLTTALMKNVRNPAVSSSSAAMAWNRQQADNDDYLKGREGRCRRSGFVLWHCPARGFVTKKKRTKFRDAAVPTLRLEQLKVRDAGIAYCTAQNFTVLYSTALYCTVLILHVFCPVPSCPVLYSPVPVLFVLWCTVRSCIRCLV